MNKLFDYIVPALGVVALIVIFGVYSYLTAIPALGNEAESRALEDRTYFAANQQKYADCYHTTKSNGDFSVATITNRLFNEGVSQQKLETLEAQFKNKYVQQCDPILKEYEERYSQHDKHKKEAAESRLSKLDKLLGKKAEVASEPSPIFSLYQEYEPRSLQYPTNGSAKMLYTAADYEEYVKQNL